MFPFPLKSNSGPRGFAVALRVKFHHKISKDHLMVRVAQKCKHIHFCEYIGHRPPGKSLCNLVVKIHLCCVALSEGADTVN